MRGPPRADGPRLLLKGLGCSPPGPLCAVGSCGLGSGHLCRPETLCRFRCFRCSSASSCSCRTSSLALASLRPKGTICPVETHGLPPWSQPHTPGLAPLPSLTGRGGMGQSRAEGRGGQVQQGARPPAGPRPGTAPRAHTSHPQMNPVWARVVTAASESHGLCPALCRLCDLLRGSRAQASPRSQPWAWYRIPPPGLGLAVSTGVSGSDTGEAPGSGP